LLWFFAGCQGPTGCGHVAPIGIRAALRIMGSGKATIHSMKSQILRVSKEVLRIKITAYC
jgi:hypothetical protein